MSEHEVKIKINQGRGTISINGHPVENMVTSLRLYMDANNRQPRLVLDLDPIMLATEIDGVQVFVDQEAIEALKSMGWTPPEDLDGARLPTHSAPAPDTEGTTGR